MASQSSSPSFETLPLATRVHVLGAGPVGLVVTALLQTNDRFSVHLYERRRDYTRTRMVQLAQYLVADSIASYCTDYIDGESVEAIFEPSELAEGPTFRESIPPDLMGLLRGWTRGFCPLNDIERGLSELHGLAEDEGKLCVAVDPLMIADERSRSLGACRAGEYERQRPPVASASEPELRQDLPRALVHAPTHLQHRRPEVPRILLEQLAQLLVHPPAEARALDDDVPHPVPLFQRHIDDPVEPAERPAHARNPAIEVHAGLAPADQQVGEEVDRRPVEDAVPNAALDAGDGALELQLEILDGGWMGRLMALRLEQVVRLVDDGVAGE
jgi:hypothetical protein